MRGGLREASTGDIAALIEAERACFGPEAWTPGMVREEFERGGGVQWVVTGGAVAPGEASPPAAGGRCAQGGGGENVIIGFAFGWLVIDELHVLHVATLPAHRRAGVGRALLRALLAAPGAQSAWLEVRADNPGAIGLYASEGFMEVGRRKRYYADGEDAVVMRR